MRRRQLLVMVLALVVFGCGGQDTRSQDPQSADSVPTTGASTTVTAAPETIAEEAEPDVAWPSKRIHPTLVHDPTGQQLIMVSGMSRMQRRVDRRDVWTLDTKDFTWTFVGDAEPLDALINYGVDTESDALVGFNLEPAQTWLFDLVSQTWVQRSPAEQPESTSANPRFGAPLTYDSQSDRLILFGGGSPWHMYTDTWAYDVNSDEWELMSPETSPSPRAMYATAYDSESDRVLLWGGFTGTEENDVQMWAYDYNSDTWEALENVGGPQQHWERHGMAYIPGKDRVLFYSGMLEEEGVLPAETWYYDYNTNSWIELDVETSPPDLAMYGMEYDPEIGKVVLFGGEMTSKYAANISRDIWVFDPESEDWALVPGPGS